MIRGFYTALSGVVASMRRQDVVADNLANLNTIGFKQSRTTQDQFGLDLVVSDGGDLGYLGTGTIPTGLKLDLNQGALEETGRVSDLALEGDGLFEVLTPSGIAYTRAGNFQVDSNGTMVTEQGYAVLDVTGRPIQIPADSAASFTVGDDGTIAETGQRIGLIAWPAAGVSRLGENLYGAAGPLLPATGKVHQRMIEHSNTDAASAMTELINYQRSFQLASRALSLQDNTLGEAIALGRLR